MLTMEDSNCSMSTGCCDAVTRSRCPGVDWSCCLVQQGFLPNLFSLREAENMKRRQQLMKVKETSLQHVYISGTQCILPLDLSFWLPSGTLVR